jgi:hypothetical protein
MNEATRVRRDSAERMARRWAAEDGVLAVLLAGSVVEEACDDSSDVDMCVYWAQPPRADVLDAVKAEHGSGERFLFLGRPEDGGCVESYAIGGIRHDFAHTTLEVWEQQTAEVLDQLNVDSLWQKGMHGTLHGVALHGAEVIDRLRARITPYPDALQLAMLQRHCAFPRQEVLERYARARGDLLFYYELLTKLATNLLFTLCAVNRVYHAMEFKRLSRFVARELPLAPPGLAARLDALLTADPTAPGDGGSGPAAPAPDLGALVAETLALVDTHCPQFDTAPVRQRWTMTT